MLRMMPMAVRATLLHMDREEISSLDWARLADRVRHRRLVELGLSQEELAVRADVSLKTVSNIEQARVPMSWPRKMAKVTYALGWAAGSEIEVLRGGEPTLRSDVMSESESPETDAVFILRHLHDAPASTLRRLRRQLELDLEDSNHRSS